MAYCKLCGAEVNDIDFPDHLWEYHCLNYRDYYEVTREIPGPEDCWRCGGLKYPLSYIHPNFRGSPCWGCMKKKTQIENAKRQVLEAMREYTDEVLGNKFYRHLLASDTSRSMSLTHGLPQTTGIIDSLAKRDKMTIDNRGEIFKVITRSIANSPEISERNMANLEIESYRYSCLPVGDSTYEIILDHGVYYVELPEIVPYEVKHHQRSSILNKGKSARPNGKRLRIGSTDRVYKFYDNPDSVLSKSIFKVTGKLRDSDREALNYVFLSAKPFCEIIQEIYLEICPSLTGIYDRVFFKNYIPLSKPSSEFELEFSMNTRETKKDILTLQVWS